MNRIFPLFSLAILFFVLSGCYSEDVHKGRLPLAGVDDAYLYKDEVDLMYAAYGQGGDSARFYRDYIERWAVERLFYNKATENVLSTDEIETMVENYRRGLILSVYQDGLVEQQLVPDISREEVERFYNENESMFEQEEPIFKGLLLKVSDRSPGIAKLRSWCMKRSTEDLERIEKYSIANSAYYDCFIEEWRTCADIAKQTPLTTSQLNERLKKRETIEFKDGGYIYFIGADTLVQDGDVKPMEMVFPEIVEFLVNLRKADFIKATKRTLYDEALKVGDVVLY